MTQHNMVLYLRGKYKIIQNFIRINSIMRNEIVKGEGSIPSFADHSGQRSIGDVNLLLDFIFLMKIH